jgi:hypothetical protein
MSDKLATLTARKAKLAADAAKLLDQADDIQAEIVAIEQEAKADAYIARFSGDLTEDQKARMKSVLIEAQAAAADAGANPAGGY